MPSASSELARDWLAGYARSYPPDAPARPPSPRFDTILAELAERPYGLTLPEASPNVHQPNADSEEAPMPGANTREKSRCHACGAVGHTARNKNCPKRGEARAGHQKRLPASRKDPKPKRARGVSARPMPSPDVAAVNGHGSPAALVELRQRIAEELVDARSEVRALERLAARIGVEVAR